MTGNFRIDLVSLKLAAGYAVLMIVGAAVFLGMAHLCYLFYSWLRASYSELGANSLWLILSFIVVTGVNYMMIRRKEGNGSAE